MRKELLKWVLWEEETRNGGIYVESFGGCAYVHSTNLSVTRIARLLLLASLMVSIGGQWMVLQGVAWVGMAVSYSLEEGSVSSGLSKTFDGEHPCPLCKAVKKSSQDNDAAAPGEKGKGFGKTKVELATENIVCLFPPVPMRMAHAVDQAVVEARQIVPEVPPPKVAA